MAAYVRVYKCMGFSFAALLNCKTTENLIQYPLYMRNNSGPSPFEYL